MTEKELVQKVQEYYSRTAGAGNFYIWRSPAFQKMRWDIFGVFDLIVLLKGRDEPTFIQVTTAPNLSARRRKIALFFQEIKMRINWCYIFAWHDKINDFIIEEV